MPAVTEEEIIVDGVEKKPATTNDSTCGHAEEVKTNHQQQAEGAKDGTQQATAGDGTDAKSDDPGKSTTDHLHQRSRKPPSIPVFSHLREMHSVVIHLKQYPRFLLYYIPLEILHLAGAVSFLVVAHFMRDDFTEALSGSTNHPLNPGGGQSFQSTTHVMVAGIVVGVLMIVGNVTPFFARISIDELKEGMKVEQALNVVKKLFELPHDTMISTPVGEFAQLMGKTFQLDMVVPGLYLTVFPLFAQTLVAVIFIAVVYGYLAIVQLAVFLLYSFLAYIVAGRKVAKSKNSMKAFMSEWGNLLGVAQNYELAHHFGNVDLEVSRARKSFNKISQEAALVMGVDWDSVGLQVLTMICSGCFIGLCLLEMSQGDDKITFIELGSLGMYFFHWAVGLAAYAQTITQIRTGVVEYHVIHEFLDRYSATADIKGAEDIDPMLPQISIEFCNVSFSYADKEILKDVSFKVNAGETLGLAGPSGCGKSTILRLLLRFYAPTHGEIKIDGRSIKSATGASLRKLFSVVTQDAKLFNASLRENIGYGKIGSSDTDILQAATSAELDLEALSKSDEGSTNDTGHVVVPMTTDKHYSILDKMCGEGGAKMSGGQQQRVGVARALLKNGSCFLLDEPTAALDNVVSKELVKTLNNLSRQGCGDDGKQSSNGKTVVHITHRLEELKQADQILYLDDGKVIERGTYRELVAMQDGVFAKQVAASTTANKE